MSKSSQQLLYWMQDGKVSFYGFLPIRVIIPLKYKSNISFLNYLNYYYDQNDNTRQSRNEIFDCHKPFLVNLIKNNQNEYNKHIEAEKKAEYFLDMSEEEKAYVLNKLEELTKES